MRKKIVLALVIIGILIFINSCGGLLGTSIEDRIDSFETALNSSDRTDIWLNFSSTDCNDYNSLSDIAYWDTHSIFQNDDWNFGSLSVDGTYVNVTYTHSGGASGDLLFRYELVNNGDDLLGENWEIATIWVDDMSIPVID
jgi:hypothetical protein